MVHHSHSGDGGFPNDDALASPASLSVAVLRPAHRQRPSPKELLDEPAQA